MRRDAAGGPRLAASAVVLTAPATPGFGPARQPGNQGGRAISVLVAGPGQPAQAGGDF